MKKHRFLPTIAILIFTLIPTTILQATPLKLSDVYQALNQTLSIPQRTSLTDKHNQASIQQAKSAYQLQVSAQSQSDINTEGETGFSTGLHTTFSLIPDPQQESASNTVSTQAEINVLNETQRQLVYYSDATTLYFRALTAQEAAKHTDTLIEILNQQHRWLKNQVAIGKRKPSAITSIQLTTQSLQLQKLQYLRQKQENMVKLSSLTGIATTAELQVPNVAVPSEISENQLRKRLDIRKQEIVLTGLKLQMNTLKRTYWPQFSTFGGIVHESEPVGLVGVSARWNLLDGDSRALAQTQLSVKYDLEMMTLNEQLKVANGESQARYDTLRSLEKEVKLAKTAVTTAEAQYRQYHNEYVQNLIQLLEVLQTLTTWHETKLDLSRRQIALQEAIALVPITLLNQSPSLTSTTEAR